jgi:Lar family restriction alleviation protein
MSAQTRELLPCPFCGGEAQFDRRGTERYSTIVSCTNCGVIHESGDSGARVGSSWNRRQLSAPGAGLSYSDIRKIFADETGFDIDSQGCDLFGFAKAIEKAALRAPQADAIAALHTDLAYYQAKWEHELSTVSKIERERDALREEVSRLTENQRQQDSATAFVMERDEKERDALRKEIEELRGAIPCCQDWDNCQTRCLPLAENWRMAAKAAERELSAHMDKVAELDKANTGLAQESHTLRTLLSALVDAVDGIDDLDEMDGEEYQTSSKNLDEAMEAARPHTEEALIQRQISIDSAIKAERGK